MNVDQLSALKKRAEKATEVAKDIELLQGASPHALPENLLRDVIEGRNKPEATWKPTYCRF